MTTKSEDTQVTPEGVESNKAWEGFKRGVWCDSIDVRDFIQQNYTPYEGDSSFLAPATERTNKVWQSLVDLFPEEREKGVYDIDAKTPSTITAHAPGYINADDNVIVGLQTDAPLKRAIMPNGGWRMVEKSLKNSLQFNMETTAFRWFRKAVFFYHKNL